MKESWIVNDALDRPLKVGDRVDRNGQVYTVIGLTNIAEEDFVILGGDNKQARLKKPYCEMAQWVTKVTK